MPTKLTANAFASEIQKFGWNIGPHSYGIPRIFGKKSAKLIIGDFCSIAGGVTINLGAEHRPDWVTTYPFPIFRDEWPTEMRILGHPHSKGDVVIGNDVWIGRNATVISGVTIGDGAVIGGGAVVNTDVPPYGIALGNPSRTFKKRFSNTTIERLLKLRWWDWPEEKIRKAIPMLCAVQIDEFLDRYEAEV